MLIVKTRKIRAHEVGLYFRDREFRGLLAPGGYWFLDPLGRVQVDVARQRDTWLVHPDLDVIVKSGALEGKTQVLDLKDKQRALVWIDDRFARVLTPGLHALWTGFHDVRVEVLDAAGARLSHESLHTVLKSPEAGKALDTHSVEEGHTGLFYLDGQYVESLKPGQYAFWKNVGKVRLYNVDERETVLDIGGQEIMTADKVTLRLNAVVTYRIVDARKSVAVSEDTKQALYRDAQLALRAVVGAHELDRLLTDKEAVADQMETLVRRRAGEFGIEIIGLGVRDIILPGEMKDLLNKVTEAKKAAEANLITRREETAAMRSQANTAKVLDSTPTLMRLRELEVLERIAGSSQLQVILGEKGLADRVSHLI